MVKKFQTYFTLNDYIFGSVKLTKNAYPDKYKCSCHGIGCDSCSEFSFTDGTMGKNLIVFGADMSLIMIIKKVW